MRRYQFLLTLGFLGAGCGFGGHGSPATAPDAEYTSGHEAPRGGYTEEAPPPPQADIAVPRPTTPGNPGYSPPRVTPGAPLTVTLQTVPVVPVPPPLPIPSVQQQQVPQLTAATVSDADRRDNFLGFLARNPHEYQRVGLDMSRRLRMRVIDGQGRPVPDARIEISGQQQLTALGRTHADGYWDYYPGVVGGVGAGDAIATIDVGQTRAQIEFEIPMQGDAQDITVRLDQVQAATPRALDLAFLIDATGSMGDELAYVTSEIASIIHRVRADLPETRIRLGATFYRDRTDSAPLQEIPFTADVFGFASAMQQVHATGGGDYPEDVNLGLEAAFHRLDWADDAVRVMVLIGDAPPQRYSTQFSYREAALEAAATGIRILPVAASGANREVELLFRSLGALTSTPYVYLTDDSGVGNRHLEADTDRVGVEYFADALVRMLVADLSGLGMHEAI